ncbi:Hexokinase-3 [Toxocara canis]|uniref:Phosphotransferase n=1 Tax=Toxocara canis TaxID=6265 RepID=A0A0B2VXX7_TOXCA|nr:Hexokinase-3 [Toxocara canis]
MIINTEWGAYGDGGELEFIRTRFDVLVDEGTVNPGKQLYEKMISGMYMGELVRVMLVYLAEHGLLFENVSYGPLKASHSFPTKYVSEIEGDIEPDGTRTYDKTHQILEDIGIEDTADHDLQTVAYVCSLVSRRAAELCGAGIATLLNRMQKPSVTASDTVKRNRISPESALVQIRSMTKYSSFSSPPALTPTPLPPPAMWYDIHFGQYLDDWHYQEI